MATWLSRSRSQLLRSLTASSTLKLIQDQEQEILVLGHVLLNLDRRYLYHLEKLVGSYGFNRTVLKLQEVKKALENENCGLDLFFSRAAKARLDAFQLSNAFLGVKSHHGMSQAMELLQGDSRRLYKLAAATQVKMRFEKRWDVSNFDPHDAFVGALQYRSVNTKLRRLEQRFPVWFLRALAETGNLIWLDKNAGYTQRVVDALEAGLKLVMSADTAQQATYVCIARSPNIINARPAALYKKIVSMKDGALGEATADFLLKHPEVLLPSFKGDIAERYLQMSAWSQTVFPEKSRQRLGSLGCSIGYLADRRFDRIAQRLHYAARNGGDQLHYTFNYYERARNTEFEKSHPGYQNWLKAMHQTELDPQQEQQLQEEFQAICDNVTLLELVFMFPAFAGTVRVAPVLTSLPQLQFLKSFFQKDNLKIIKSDHTAHVLMQMKPEEIKHIYTVLQGSGELNGWDIKRLILMHPQVLTCPNTLQDLRQNLELFQKLFPKRKAVSLVGIQFLSNSFQENQMRSLFLAAQGVTAAPDWYSLSSDEFCAKMRSKLSDYTHFKETMKVPGSS